MDKLRDWPVSGLTRDRIRRDSVDIRKRLGVHALKRFNFIHVLRNRVPLLGGRFDQLRVITRNASDLNGMPAVTHFVEGKGIRIFISPEVEEAAIDECPDAQKILMHEFGHARYHNEAPKAFLAGAYEAISYLESCETSAEWQADEAQLSLVAPDNLIEQFKNWQTLARECNLTPDDAKKAIEIYSTTISRRSEHPAYNAFKRDRLLISRQADENLSPYIEGLWLQLESAPDKDPFSYRLCPRGFLISRDEYLKMTPCGWRIKNGAIEAYYHIA